MTGNPKCIVCGRAIKKRVETIWVQPVSDSAASFPGARVKADLRTRADCQRHSNHQVISVSKNRSGLVTAFNVWDGQSYHCEFFCTNSCAMDQGYASARHGDRFTWKERAR